MAQESDMLPDRIVAQWFLDNHEDIDLRHLDDLTDLVRRARNDMRETPVLWRVAMPGGYGEIFDTEAAAKEEANKWWRGRVEPLSVATGEGT